MSRFALNIIEHIKGSQAEVDPINTFGKLEEAQRNRQAINVQSGKPVYCKYSSRWLCWDGRYPLAIEWNAISDPRDAEYVFEWYAHELDAVADGTHPSLHGDGRWLNKGVEVEESDSEEEIEELVKLPDDIYPIRRSIHIGVKRPLESPESSEDEYESDFVVSDSEAEREDEDFVDSESEEDDSFSD